MPDRVFRDEILSSPRYWLLSNDTARMLFYHLGLRADDLGIFRAANYTIRQECFGVDNKPAPEALAKLLGELSAVDLIRLYQIDGIEYGFIPRWKQRLRIFKSRFPLPPESIRDNAINDMITKLSVICPTPVRHVSAERKGKEKKGKETREESSLEHPVDNSKKPNGPFLKIHNPHKPGSKKWWTDLYSIIETGKQYGIAPRPGEDRDSLYLRIRAAIKAQQPPKEAP
jgi:hypothetical protein